MRILRRTLALAVCTALGCGGPRAPVRPATLTGRVLHYRPLEMATDAKLPGQAVILGTDEADGSTLLPLPVAPSTSVVDAMVVAPDGSGAVGGDLIAITLTAAMAATPTTAAAAPATGDTLHAGATGPPANARWQHDVESAALIAAIALGKDRHGLALSAVPARPPAEAETSALLAAGFLATLTGAKIDPAATLAGSLAPDGTLVPVSGLPEQFQAAIAHGKKLLGYPSGMRGARSRATGKDVDLAQLARDHHALAVELTNVSDAYQLLTHKQLPAPVPVSEADMALDPDTLASLGTQYLAWQKRLAGEWPHLVQLEQAGRLPAMLAGMVRLARELREAAERLYRGGKLAAAHRRMLAAWEYAAGANHTYAVLTKLQAGDPEGALVVLTGLATAEPSPNAMLERLAALTEPVALGPTVLGDQLAILAALQAALRGVSHHAFASGALHDATQALATWADKSAAERTAPATAEAMTAMVAPVVLGLLRAITEAALAEQSQQLARGEGVAHTWSPTEATRLATEFQAVSAAALRHVEALLVEPLARSTGSIEEARRRIAQTSPDYLLADTLSRAPASGVPRELAATWSEGSAHGSLLALAGQTIAHRSAALLITRHGALAVHLDDRGTAVAVESPDALRHLLANAQRGVRAEARAARIATGAIPLPARLAYQLAAVEATGSVADQLDALAELWTASELCQLAVMLARS